MFGQIQVKTQTIAIGVGSGHAYFLWSFRSLCGSRDSKRGARTGLGLLWGRGRLIPRTEAIALLIELSMELRACRYAQLSGLPLRTRPAAYRTFRKLGKLFLVRFGRLSYIGLALCATFVVAFVAINALTFEGSWGGFLIFVIGFPISIPIVLVGALSPMAFKPLMLSCGCIWWYFVGWLVEKKVLKQ